MIVVVCLLVQFAVIGHGALGCFDAEAEMAFRTKREGMSAGIIAKPIPVGNPGRLPRALDWRLRTVLSPVQNQHRPMYCGSCWAFGAASTIVDRMRVKHRHSADNNTVLSAQALLACANSGSCRGGFYSGVFEYALKSGVPDETCSPYLAADADCTDFLLCGTCSDFEVCAPVTKYSKYKIYSYGYVSGEHAIMKEVHMRGPVVCSMYVSPDFLANYTGGIYAQCYDIVPLANHVVSVVGWGLDTDQNGLPLPYWIAKNSWGTFWGEDGYFRVPRHSYAKGCSLGIENDCGFPLV